MDKKLNKFAISGSELRSKAEEKLASLPAAAETFSGEMDTRRLLHELQVHQIELEMQNNELQRIIAEKSDHERHLRNIIENTPAGYLRIDPEGNLLDVNNAWLRMHGYYAKDEVIGKHFSIMQVESDTDSLVSYVDELKTGKPIPFGELDTRRKDGSVGHQIFTAHPVIHAGKIAGLEWFSIDVSDLIRLREEKQLLQKQKLESLGVLAGGIAHDFNNLLTIIIGHCSLAKLQPITALENIPPIEKAAERAAELCRLMLAYAGKSQFIEKHVNILKLVEETIEILKSSIGKNVEITTGLSPDIPHIKADASKISQIIMNLIINASEAIGEAQGKIIVSLSKSTVRVGHSENDHLGKPIPAGCYVCLEVTDNGSGMDEETKRRIFEPFFTTKFTGRGLGMSAVLGSIMAHKGTLQLVSQPGTGSIFRIYLPIQANSCVEDEADLQFDPSESWRGNGTILLVEDEAEVLSIAKTLLEELGFTVIAATNGKEALELFQKNETGISLVVTDIGMPVMDGYTLVRELKKRKPELPIIICTGFGSAAASSRIACEDMAGLIIKPFNFNKMRNVLKNVVETTAAHA